MSENWVNQISALPTVCVFVLMVKFYINFTFSFTAFNKLTKCISFLKYIFVTRFKEVIYLLDIIIMKQWMTTLYNTKCQDWSQNRKFIKHICTTN